MDCLRLIDKKMKKIENKIKIRKTRKEDLIEIQKMICDTYKKFNKKEGTKKAMERYLEGHNPKQDFNKILIKFKKSEISLVCILDNKIVGVVRGKKGDMGNLFIHKKFQGEKIGKKLIESFEKLSKKEGVEEIKLKSSLYAIPFYQKMSYKKTTGMRNYKGLKYQPMRKELK